MTSLQVLDPQALHDAAIDEMLFDNLLDVVAVLIRVPDRVRIHDHNRAFTATIQAAGRIDSHAALARDVEILGATLGILTHFGGGMIFAAHIPVVAVVGAEEHVAFVIRHDRLTA
jgi:hypothetical protein